ncbi:MAG TPA: hypothetical protein VF710_05030 [Longimicrobium sp.]|jgi:hypothetical protein
MSKLLGILLLLIGAVVLVPQLRARAMPHVQPALNPFYEWSARNRVNDIVEILHEEETLGRNIPDPASFAGFVARRDFQQDAANDPWGTPFYLRLTRKAYFVGSAGRDRLPNTADDIVSAPQPRNPAVRR